MSMTANDSQPLARGSPTNVDSNVSSPRGSGITAWYQGRNSETSSATPPRPASGSALRTGLGRLERVAHQHRDRHRADAAGHRRDQPRALGGGCELYVARELAVQAVHADVDDDRALLDPVALDQVRDADGGDEDVRPPADVGEVARARVGGGDGGVGVQQQRGHRLADEVRAP